MLNGIEKIFAENGLLSQALPDYELRAGQLRMAKAIAQTLTEPSPGHAPTAGGSRQARMLAVEAETGIGKTLAYLVPACLSGLKIVVSTGTLNLQEQILAKEIPFIRTHLQPGITALCVKGRQNYACRYQCNQLLSAPQARLFDDSAELNELREWLEQTRSGDRAELPWLPDNSPLWDQISSSSAKCLGPRCPENAGCFITQLRKKAAAAQILIVNHHLFFSDLALRRFGHAEVLPRYQAVIFDEAHHLENVATSYFGTTFSHYQLLDLIKDIETMAADHLNKGPDQSKTVQIARSLATQANSLAQLFPAERGRYPLHEIIAQIPGWQEEQQALAMALDSLNKHLGTSLFTFEGWDSPRRRGQELATSFAMITNELDPSAVYWCERREKTISLTASPIDIAQELHENLYPEVESIIFTSATLTTGGSFSYMFRRLGLDRNTESLSLPSPFDYATRTKLYIPASGFPEPHQPAFASQIQAQVQEILACSHGRALLLFTSIRAMRQMQAFLVDRLPYPVLMQGDAPKHLLLATFQRETHSVLLAVASFWEGINVPGESLSCLIIDKLPFEVPSDPVIMARIKQIKEEGGNPFFEFQVPRAILSLRQGIGRLMRAAADQGLLAIMDIRLFSKGYGHQFLDSLPPSPVIRSLNEVRLFFETNQPCPGKPHEP